MARFLVVDDDVRVLEVTTLMLEAAGHTVTVAVDGREALRLFDQLPADVVITDIFMPNGDGIETIATLKQKNPTLPIIAISGGSLEMDYLAAARQVGAQWVLDKPFKDADLLRLATNALGG